MSKRIPPPHPCCYCNEMVEPHHQRQYFADRPEPVHHACFMRQIIGSAAHIKKRCSCYVPGASETDDPSLTPRQAAEAAWQAWEQQQLEDYLSYRVKRPRDCELFGASKLIDKHIATITCPVCGFTSANPNDVREGYCGRCHDWTRK